MLKLPVRNTLTLLLAAAVLAGCAAPGTLDLTPQGGTPSPAVTETLRPEPTRTPTVTPTPAWLVPEAELSRVRLLVLHPWVGESGQALDQLAAEFNAANTWGIQVMLESTGSTALLYDRVEQGLAGEGERPHLAVASPEQAFSWDELSGQVADLQPFLQDGAYGLEDPAGEIFLAGLQADGRLLGLPLLAGTRALFYNQTWGGELGFAAPPATLDEFREQACAASVHNLADGDLDNDGTGGWYADADALTVLSWMRGFRQQDPGGSTGLEYGFDTPEAEDALTFLREMVDDSCAWIGRQPTAYEYFANRYALFYSGSLPETLVQARTMQRLGSEDVWTVIPFPGEDGPVALLDQTALVVFEGSPAETLSAWLFARWLAAPERQAALAEASALAPVSAAALAKMAGFRSHNAQWSAGADLLSFAQNPPSRGSWRVARLVLEDAAWQSLQAYLTAEDIPFILEQLDATIREVGALEGY